MNLRLPPPRPLVFGRPLRLPLMVVRVAAGFPSPAEDYVEGQLDLNEHLIRHPAATFYVRASGDSMRGAGIHAGDLLIVDRAEPATSGRVVIASVDGELLVKRLIRQGGRIVLQAENESFAPMSFAEDEGGELRVWGVVTAVVHPL